MAPLLDKLSEKKLCLNIAFGEIYCFAAVFSNRIHKYSLSSQLFEAWLRWKRTMGDLTFLSLPVIIININRNYMKIMYLQRTSENKDMLAQNCEFL